MYCVFNRLIVAGPVQCNSLQGFQFTISGWTTDLRSNASDFAYNSVPSFGALNVIGTVLNRDADFLKGI